MAANKHRLPGVKPVKSHMMCRMRVYIFWTYWYAFSLAPWACHFKRTYSLLFSPFLPDMYGTSFTLLYDELMSGCHSRLRTGVQEVQPTMGALRGDRISNQRCPPTMRGKWLNPECQSLCCRYTYRDVVNTVVIRP